MSRCHAGAATESGARMAEPWIRVHAGLIDKPIIDRACTALGVSEHEAIGLLVTFWGAVSENVVGGHVGGLSDRQLERWARWTGDSGRFAKFIRECHLDEEGRINEWLDYAGALETRRAKERERLRNKRNGVAQQTTNNGDVVARLLQPARANETIRDETTSSSAPRVWTFEGEPLSTAAQPALAAILRRASDENACRTALASMLSGNDPATPQPTLPAFEQALIDFAANGERWNAAYFRTYLKRAAKPSPDIGAPQNGAARRATTGRAALLMGEIRELIQSHQPPGQAITRFIRRADVERLGTDVLAAYDAIGGAERVIGATGEQVSFLVRDFATALKAAEESNQRQTA